MEQSNAKGRQELHTRRLEAWRKDLHHEKDKESSQRIPNPRTRGQIGRLCNLKDHQRGNSWISGYSSPRDDRVPANWKSNLPQRYRPRKKREKETERETKKTQRKTEIVEPSSLFPTLFPATRERFRGTADERYFPYVSATRPRI